MLSSKKVDLKKNQSNVLTSGILRKLPAKKQKLTEQKKQQLDAKY